MTARDDPWTDRRWKAVRGTAPGLRSLLGRGEWVLLHAGAEKRRFRVETPRGPLFAVWREGGRRRCRWAFRRALRLHHQGLPMPAPLGLFLGSPREALYVAEWCGDLVAWPDFVAGARDPMAAAAGVATLLARLHGAGFVCGDPRRDLGVRAEQRGGSPVVVAVDRVRRPWGRGRRDLDLARLVEGLPDHPGVRDAATRAYGRAMGRDLP